MLKLNKDKILQKYFPVIFNYLRDRYFNGDTSFYNLINSDPDNLYIALKKSGVKFLKHDTKKKRLFFKYKNLKVTTDYIVGNLMENFGYEIFKHTNSLITKDSLVFDIGTNKGFSTLYFSQNIFVKRIVGFEIDKKLGTFFKENMKLNPSISKKIDFNNYGLGSRDEVVEIYSTNDNDSITTKEKSFFNSGWSEQRKTKLIKSTAKVKKASKVILEYISKYPELDLVMAIDIEGAEYEVFKELFDSRVIEKFSIITGEFHNSFESLKKYFKDFEVLEFSEKKVQNNIVGTFTLRRKY